MRTSTAPGRASARAAAAMLAILSSAAAAHAADIAPQATTAPPPMRLGAPLREAAPPAPGMTRLTGSVWIEGPGFDVKYGMSYDACAQRCLGNARCVMIEYYRPEKKCNLYDAVRPRKAGGASDVAIRNP